MLSCENGISGMKQTAAVCLSPPKKKKHGMGPLKKIGSIFFESQGAATSGRLYDTVHGYTDILLTVVHPRILPIKSRVGQAVCSKDTFVFLVPSCIQTNRHFQSLSEMDISFTI